MRSRLTRSRWAIRAVRPRRWGPASMLLVMGLNAGGCEGEDDPCVYEGDPRMRVTPYLGQAELDEDTTDFPVFPAPQGVPASEIDLRLEGVVMESISTINVVVVADSIGSVSNTIYTERSIGFACHEEGGLFAERVPVNYQTPIFFAEDLADLTGTLTITVSGETPVTESFPIEFRVTSL